jgi:hypothetical protein
VPRFYFDIRLKNGTVLEDELGIELPDAEAARDEAIAGAVGLSQERSGSRNYMDCAFEVRDKQRQPLFTLPFDLATAGRRSVH